MKIGIMTFWWSEDNYGQLLQCYALQKYLRDAGHEAFLIRYDPRKDYPKTSLIIKILKAFNPAKLIRYLSYKNRMHKSLNEQKENNRYFSSFRDKYIKQSEKIYSSYEELKQDPPDADMYIVGSDQVWNFSFHTTVKKCKNRIHAYFLDFGKPETKRVSYAASWSCTGLPEDIITEIRPLLQRFDYVSVREESGIDLCKQCGCFTSEQVLDPTMLLPAETYKELYNSADKMELSNNKYLLLYLLGNKCDFDIETVYSFAHERNLEIIYVSGNAQFDKYTKTFATIPEWLYLVDNAEYVITNSYHCSVFSLKFNKQFGVIPLCGNGASMNTRLTTLFEQWSIKPRLIVNKDFSVLDLEYKTVEPQNTNFDIEKICK